MPQGIALFIVAVQKGVPMTKHEDRVLSLDGLRGLGALLVFLYHIDIMVKPFGDRGGGSKSLPWWRLGHGVLCSFRYRIVPSSI